MQVRDRMDIHQAPLGEEFPPGHFRRIAEVVGRTDAEEQVPIRDEVGLQDEQDQQRGKTCQPGGGSQDGSGLAAVTDEETGHRHGPHGEARQPHGAGESGQDPGRQPPSPVIALQGMQQGMERGEDQQREQPVRGVEVGRLDGHGGRGDHEDGEHSGRLAEPAAAQQPDQPQGQAGDQRREGAGRQVDMPDRFGRAALEVEAEDEAVELQDPAQEIDGQGTVGGQPGGEGVNGTQGRADEGCLVGMEVIEGPAALGGRSPRHHEGTVSSGQSDQAQGEAQYQAQDQAGGGDPDLATGKAHAPLPSMHPDRCGASTQGPTCLSRPPAAAGAGGWRPGRPAPSPRRRRAPASVR